MKKVSLNVKDDLDILVLEKSLLARQKHIDNTPNDMKLSHYENEINIIKKWLIELNEQKDLK